MPTDKTYQQIRMSVFVMWEPTYFGSHDKPIAPLLVGLRRFFFYTPTRHPQGGLGLIKLFPWEYEYYHLSTLVNFHTTPQLLVVYYGICPSVHTEKHL